MMHLCSTCSSGFTRRAELNRHYREKHRYILTFTCEECKYETERRGDLKKHYLRRHPKIAEDYDDILLCPASKKFLKRQGGEAIALAAKEGEAKRKRKGNPTPSPRPIPKIKRPARLAPKRPTSALERLADELQLTVSDDELDSLPSTKSSAPDAPAVDGEPEKTTSKSSAPDAPAADDEPEKAEPQPSLDDERHVEVTSDEDSIVIRVNRAPGGYCHMRIHKVIVIAEKYTYVHGYQHRVETTTTTAYFENEA